MVIVDTTVWIDYLHSIASPEAAWLDHELSQQRLGLTDLILCEVLQGIREEAAFRRVQSKLLNFEAFATGGVELAVASARNYRTLRALGHTVHKTVDCLIATFCLDAGHALLHRDRDFDPFEKHLGLRVVHP